MSNQAETAVLVRSGVAGALYAAIVFAAGFCFGAIRVLWVAPRLGEALAVGLEAPIMLAVSWMVCRGCTRALRIPSRPAERIVMGGVALAVLVLEEWQLAVLLGRSSRQFFASYLGLAGTIGLLTQVAFASLPLLQYCAYVKTRGTAGPDGPPAVR